MEFKAQIMDEAAVQRSLARLTHEIIERNKGIDNILLVGIRRRGLPLAQHIAANMEKFEGASCPVGYMDITFYRDDLTEISSLPDAGESHFPVSVTGKDVILVDDVIFTGRTARAAMEGIFAFGRPASVQLCVLIDRGHRELPSGAAHPSRLRGQEHPHFEGRAHLGDRASGGQRALGRQAVFAPLKKRIEYRKKEREYKQ